MTLTDLLPAVEKIAANPSVRDLRRITYLSTYPSILSAGSVPTRITPDRFNQLAAMAYGWMQRVVRIDPKHTRGALKSLARAQKANAETDILTIGVAEIAKCLNSVVGTSKVLHFVKPDVFPIWDRNIERFRSHMPKGSKIPDSYMQNVVKYFEYADQVAAIREDAEFEAFFTRFEAAFNERLTASNIAPYSISHVRAIEAAAFELATESET